MGVIHPCLCLVLAVRSHQRCLQTYTLYPSKPSSLFKHQYEQGGIGGGGLEIGHEVAHYSKTKLYVSFFPLTVTDVSTSFTQDVFSTYNQ